MSFNICTIGCGAHASKVHGPSYKKYADLHPDTVLAGCCDLDGKKAESYREAFGFRAAYTDIDTMLDTEQPDAVCLIVGESLIAPLSIHILEKGYPLMMEKPPGLNGEELRSIIGAAGKRQAPNQVAFNRWHIPLLVRLKQLMDEHAASGSQLHIRYDFYRVGREDADFATTAIHGISAVAFLAGSPFRHVRFTYQELKAAPNTVANIFMECQFASGAVAHLHFCPIAGVVAERATVHAADHTFFANLPIWSAYDTPGELIHLRRGEVQSHESGQHLADSEEMFVTNGFYGENEAFFNALRNGRRPKGDVTSALQIVEIADCIRLRKAEYRG
jgi:myo-inositol 2-dehydrogenase/D-chiro-inositol 1-dehydrogenase